MKRRNVQINTKRDEAERTELNKRNKRQRQEKRKRSINMKGKPPRKKRVGKNLH